MKGSTTSCKKFTARQGKLSFPFKSPDFCGWICLLITWSKSSSLQPSQQWLHLHGIEAVATIVLSVVGPFRFNVAMLVLPFCVKGGILGSNLGIHVDFNMVPRYSTLQAGWYIPNLWIWCMRAPNTWIFEVFQHSYKATSNVTVQFRWNANFGTQRALVGGLKETPSLCLWETFT